MAASLSSLGIGSQGVLSFNVIDKLRKVDENAIIVPIDNRITQNKTKTSDLSILTTLTASLKAETSTLSDEMSYLNRTATSSNTGISISVNSGTQIQDFSFNVSALAKRDIYQSKSFANTTDTFTSTNDTININISGKDYAIDVTSATTLSDLQSQIYGATNGKVTASLLNVGGTTPYKLILKSTDTGTSNAMTITSTGGGTAVSDLGIVDDAANTTPTSHIQSAGDLSATFNNVAITRSSNTITDLITGATITANDAVSSNISIKQDTKTISDSISAFVSKYNDLMNNLVESTKYDTQTKASGTFQDTSEIKNLKTDISRNIFNLDSKGRSLSDYGVTLNSAGLLEFDSSVFNSKMQASSSDVENFFRGDTTTNGLFTNYNSMLSSYIDTSSGILTRFNTELSDEKKSLEENKTTATARLDSKYAIMAKRFAAYDSIISQLNASFQSLSMQIGSMTNGTKK
ncbi:MAG: flagellar filament capping protein FliD [Epsilonproteobacteria bacterium]|nr:flagellar filament capping protein FliD [Campylobacterota bacterium]